VPTSTLVHTGACQVRRGSNAKIVNLYKFSLRHEEAKFVIDKAKDLSPDQKLAMESVLGA
jgi:hypothetical protein